MRLAMFHHHTRSERTSPSKPRFRPQFEQLEDRCLLSYTFQSLLALGDPVPGGGGLNYTFDFEPGQLNNRGQLVYGADMTNGGEGVFMRDTLHGTNTPIARTGDQVPEGPLGKKFGPVFLGTISLNQSGETVFVFHRNNTTFPSLFTLDAALYRWSPSDGALSPRPVLLPGAPAPGGGTFHGYNFRPEINNQGTIAFGGLISTTIGPGGSAGFGLGLFQIDARGRVSKIARPGDAAPGGKTFDFVQLPSINDSGDIAFEAHVAEDQCISFPASFPTGPQIFCGQSIYAWTAETGRIRAIARQGDPAPGGGTFVYAFGPALNNLGDIAFIGGFPAAPGMGHLQSGNEDGGVFLHSGGQTIKLARPGDSMPGGGKLVSSGTFTAEVGINNNGVVAFTGVLDTDADGDGRLDTALFTWARGVLTRVAGTGTVIPGLGTIRTLKPPDLLDFSTTFSGAIMNDRGQIVIQATLTNGKGVMLLATPGEALMAAELPTTPLEETLNNKQLRPLINEAILRWQAAGADTSGLGSFDVRIADLPEGMLGLAWQKTIWIDHDAAGWGWFIDPTPWSDDEFLMDGDQGEEGRMDLLTALTHELGHLLGFEHGDEEDVMGESLSTGTRHTPSADLVASLQLVSDAILSKKEKRD